MIGDWIDSIMLTDSYDPWKIHDWWFLMTMDAHMIYDP